jgi:DNA-directed RNA polymerase subunit alpha
MDNGFQFFNLEVDESRKKTGHFLLQSLSENQGITIGNALRRVLLENIEGTAITGLKIKNVLHEFSTLPCLREDILELMLNLKQVVLKTDVKCPLYGSITVEGPGIITANNIVFNEEVSIINPNQYLGTLTKQEFLEINVKIEQGSGYLFSDQIQIENSDFLSMDAVFMPVISVNYDVKKDRQKKEESLIIEITTNGSISPELALSQASAKLVSWFVNLTGTQNLIQSEKKLAIPLKQKETILIEELQLSVRAYNCLKRKGINSIDELTKYTKDEICEIKNFGKKSAQEVFQSLKDKFNITLV